MVKKVPGPDAFAKRLRFGCGALAGFCLVVPIASRLGRRLHIPWLGWGLGAFGVTLCGVLAWRKGDEFWAGTFGRVVPWNWSWGRDRTPKK